MKFGFIGTGNMGSALARGVKKAESDILLFDVDEQKSRALADSIGAKVCTFEEVAKADFVFLGVKPNKIEEVVKSASFGENTVLISMAAGVKIEKIQKATDNPIIRIMPNLPVSLCEGMILYSLSEKVSKENEQTFLHSLFACAKTLKIDEALMDAGCAVSGCGPAFCFMFLLGLARGGEKCGIDEKDSLLLAAQTMLGSAKMILENNGNPEELIKAVCSPGGSTIEGVKVFEEENLYGICAHAVKNAYEKNIILGK